MSTVTTTSPAPAVTQAGRASRTWPLWGVLAGVLGAVATIFTNYTSSAKHVGPDVLDKLSSTTFHIGGALGYVTVACLLVLAACWRTNVVRRFPDRVATRIVADGLVTSAAALTLGYGWKLAMAIYLPGGINDDQFGDEAKFVYYVLNDFGAFIGWLGVVIAAGAIAWLSLRDKLIATWLGVVSLLPVAGVLLMSLGMAVAGYPGIVGPIWLVLASAGLSFGKHAITR